MIISNLYAIILALYSILLKIQVTFCIKDCNYQFLKILNLIIL